MLKNVDEISVCRLTSLDVVRHPLVQKIVNAYEAYEAKNAAREKKQAERKSSKPRKNHADERSKR